MQPAGNVVSHFSSIREASPPCADSIGYPLLQRCGADEEVIHDALSPFFNIHHQPQPE